MSVFPLKYASLLCPSNWRWARRRWRQRGLLFAAEVALVWFAISAHAKDWSPDDYPNPTVDTEACGRRGVKSWVCDPDGVLSYSSANVIEGVLQEIQDGRSPYSRAPCGSLGKQGYQVAVAVMRKMGISSGQDAATEAQVFAKKLHDAWGVGLRECNNGVLLLLSVDDRQVYISTGRGARETLPDKQAAVIIERMKPALRGKDYNKAVEKAVREIGMSLGGAEFKPPTDWLGNTVMAGFFGLFGFMVFKGISQSWQRRREYRGATAALERLRREQAQARAERRFPESTCPICLQEFDDDGGGSGGRPAQKQCSEGGSCKAKGSAGGLKRDDSAAGHSSDDDDGNGDDVRNPLLAANTPGGAAARRAAAAGPAGGGMSGSRASGSGGGSERKEALVLPCGHCFCDGCISRWMASNSTCPICRKPLVESPPTGAAAAGGPGAAGPSSSSTPPPQQQPRPQDRPWRPMPRSQFPGFGRSRCWDERTYLDEFDYRLMRMRELYPYYVTDSLIWSLRDQAHQGQLIDWETTLRRDMADREERARLESSGARGTSVSFGGGGGGGGGGAGGSW